MCLNTCVCIEYNFLWDVRPNGIWYEFMYKITHECRIIVCLCVFVYIKSECSANLQLSLFRAFIYYIHSCQSVGGLMSVYVCILVAMRRGLAAMRRKMFHIPVCFFFFSFPYSIEQQLLWSALFNSLMPTIVKCIHAAGI